MDGAPVRGSSEHGWATRHPFVAPQSMGGPPATRWWLLRACVGHPPPEALRLQNGRQFGRCGCAFTPAFGRAESLTHHTMKPCDGWGTR